MSKGASLTRYFTADPEHETDACAATNAEGRVCERGAACDGWHSAETAPGVAVTWAYDARAGVEGVRAAFGLPTRPAGARNRWRCVSVNDGDATLFLPAGEP